MGEETRVNGTVPGPLANLSTLVPCDDKARERYPNVWACLMPHWSEGKCTRQSGTLRVRIVGSWFEVTLSCPTEGVETTLSTETLVNLLEQLEKLLASGRAIWKPDWSSTKKARQAKVK